MKIGPFALLPGGLSVVEVASLEEWEKRAGLVFDMQKYVPWWLGDLVVFGEAQWGDDFWQVPPLGASEQMLMRFAGVARKYPIGERNLSLSWTHHVIALRADEVILRRSLLRIAESKSMTSEEFRCYVSNLFGARD